MIAIVASIAVLILGFALAYLIKRFSLGDSITLLALMLLPLLSYGILSGKISEFTAPGGWGAKFREIAQSTVDPFPITSSIEEGEFVAKGDFVQLEKAAHDVIPGKPIAMTLQLDRGGYYQSPVIAEYIKVLSKYDPEMSVVIVDEAGKYVASAKASVLANQLERDEAGPMFMEAVRGSNATEILKIAGFSDKSISETATNVEALEKMESENANRLVVIGATGLPKGILLRDSIVTRLLVQLSETD